jgi:hypothetical protein
MLASTLALSRFHVAAIWFCTNDGARRNCIGLQAIHTESILKVYGPVFKGSSERWDLSMHIHSKRIVLISFMLRTRTVSVCCIINATPAIHCGYRLTNQIVDAAQAFCTIDCSVVQTLNVILYGTCSMFTAAKPRNPSTKTD